MMIGQILSFIVEPVIMILKVQFQENVTNRLSKFLSEYKI